MVTTDAPVLARGPQPGPPSTPPPRSPALAPSSTSAEPELRFPSQPVELKGTVHSGAGLHTAVGYVLGALSLLVFIAATSGIGLLFLLAAPIIDIFRWKKVRATIRGSGIKVGHEQLPWLHKTITDFAQRLGMKEAPEVYIVEDSVQNGAAVKLGTKNIVMLTDDVVWGALQSKDPRSLGFVVGHELAHIAHNHTGAIRNMLTGVYKPLRRCDEFTADNTATALVGDAQTAAHGLTVLTVGPQLLRYVNDEALFAQADEVDGDKHAKKAERTMSHPLLLRRIANVRRRA